MRLMLVIALVQTLFWGTMVLIGERQQEYSFMKSHEVHEIYVHALSGLSPDFGPRDPSHRQSFPFAPGPCYMGYKSPAYQISFDVIGDARIESALYVPWASDNFEAYLNGNLLATPRGQFSLVPSREERRPYLIGVPRDRLLSGVNHIDMVVTRRGCTPYVETAYFGPLAQFKAYENHMLFLGHYSPLMTAIAGVFVALLTLTLIPISGYSPKILSLAVFLSTLSLRAYAFVWSGNGIEYLTFFSLVYFIQYVTFATAALSVQFWTEQKPKHALWIGAILAIYGLILSFIARTGDVYMLVMNYLNPLAVTLLTGYTAWCLWQRRKTAPKEIRRALVVASLFLSVEIYEVILVIFQQRRFVDASFYLPVVIIVAVAIHLILYGHDLYQQAEASRKNLALQVAQKEIEISQSYVRLREQESLNAIHTERQRLIRDMHDGVGGQLVSLMLQLRTEDIPKDRVEQHIQAAIDDLRLIIDSMDSVGTSLDIALAIFRERMGPRLKGAGIGLVWNNLSDNNGDSFKPQSILHIYRILQEGVTNILKYAEATEVVLTLTTEGDLFTIELTDNGKGFSVSSEKDRGRGINHMRKRAKFLGSDLELTSTIGKGTRLRFSVRIDDLNSTGA